MPDKTEVQLPHGEWVNATHVEINQAGEQWNAYLLDDGSVLKVSRLDNS